MMFHFLLLAAIGIAGADLRISVGIDPARPVVAAKLSKAVADSLPEGKVPNKSAEAILRLELASAPGTAILGSYERTGEWLRFTPRFALAAGERYRAVSGDRSVDYLVPAAKPSAAAKVAAVFPSADELPANTLKFYIHFSKSMREGPAIFDRIRLLDDRGEPVEDPWRRTELWNDDATRLTLWIHPGRIKEGVNLRDDLGPVLEPNRKYRLVIDKSVKDANGELLAAGFEKTFRTTTAIRTAIDVREWTVTVPQAGTRQPLTVAFPRPLDHALLGKCLSLTTGGLAVAGRAEIGAKEQTWSFTPERPWAEGELVLTAEERLEDVAGNTPLRPFDLDLRAPPKKPLPRTLPVRITSKSR
ncbi:MAG: hypothetical protein U0791_16145 [Gemmataceae bacterium]